MLKNTQKTFSEEEGNFHCGAIALIKVYPAWPIFTKEKEKKYNKGDFYNKECKQRH